VANQIIVNLFLGVRKRLGLRKNMLVLANAVLELGAT
jgi:hypothetical protein